MGYSSYRMVKCNFVLEEGARCKKTAFFGFRKGEPQRCADHKSDAMCLAAHGKKCERADCSKYAVCGLKGAAVRFCILHREDQMGRFGTHRPRKLQVSAPVVRIGPTKCAVDFCCKRPKFNLPDQEIPIFCDFHKTDTMVRFVVRKCKFKDCNNQAKFNDIEKITPKFCKAHRSPSMVRILFRRQCEAPDCDLEAYFNYFSEEYPRFCANHKLNYMIHLIKSKCTAINCNQLAIFCLENQRKPLFCELHKVPGTISSRELCRAKNCKQLACYNYPGSSDVLFCRAHKQDFMVNLAEIGSITDHEQGRPTRGPSESCEEPGCRRPASFNYAKQEEARFCSKHKLGGMINMSKPICSEPDCTNLATKRFPFRELSHCAKHKKQGQIEKKARCDCGESPTHSSVDMKHFYCERCSGALLELIDFRIPCDHCGARRTADRLAKVGAALLCESCAEPVVNIDIDSSLKETEEA